MMEYSVRWVLIKLVQNIGVIKYVMEFLMVSCFVFTTDEGETTISMRWSIWPYDFLVFWGCMSVSAMIVGFQLRKDVKEFNEDVANVSKSDESNEPG